MANKCKLQISRPYSEGRVRFEIFAFPTIDRAKKRAEGGEAPSVLWTGVRGLSGCSSEVALSSHEQCDFNPPRAAISLRLAPYQPNRPIKRLLDSLERRPAAGSNPPKSPHPRLAARRCRASHKCGRPPDQRGSQRGNRGQRWIGKLQLPGGDGGAEQQGRAGVELHRGGECPEGSRSLPHAASAMGANTYSYDCSGSMTQRVIGGSTYNLAYDAENRLSTVSGAASANVCI